MSLFALMIEAAPRIKNGRVWYDVEDYQAKYGKPFRFEHDFFARKDDTRDRSGK